jgi:uncharacterized membrane protein
MGSHGSHGARLRLAHGQGRRLVYLYAGLVAVVCALLVATWPTRAAEQPGDRVGARITSVVAVPCGPNRCVQVSADVAGGTSVDLGVVAAGSQLGSAGVGTQIIVTVSPDGSVYFYQDLDRRGGLAIVAAFFAGVVILFARMRGARALAGLVASAAVLYWYSAPAMLAGTDPVLVCCVTAATIAILGTCVNDGVTVESMLAGVSILAALTTTYLLGSVLFPYLSLRGLGGEHAGLVQQMLGGVDLQGLLLGGTIIGALGALDDVVITQISVVAELSHGRDRRSVIVSAMRIGRDHIGAAVNTLALAYLGASLPLLLLFAAGGNAVGVVLSSEEVATEIARTIVGSIGLILAVPFTTVLAAGFAPVAAAEGSPDPA